MSNTLFLVSDVKKNLSRGIVVFSDDEGNHAFYTTNPEFAKSLNPDVFLYHDDDDDQTSDSFSNNDAFNLLTKQIEEIHPETFGGVVSTVAFAEIPAVKYDDEVVNGYKAALVMGTRTGAICVSTRFLQKFNDSGLDLKSVGVKDDKVVVVPVFVHTKQNLIVQIGKEDQTYIDALYILKN